MNIGDNLFSKRINAEQKREIENFRDVSYGRNAADDLFAHITHRTPADTTSNPNSLRYYVEVLDKNIEAFEELRDFFDKYIPLVRESYIERIEELEKKDIQIHIKAIYNREEKTYKVVITGPTVETEEFEEQIFEDVPVRELGNYTEKYKEMVKEKYHYTNFLLEIIPD